MGGFVCVCRFVFSECVQTLLPCPPWPAGLQRAAREVPELLLQSPALVATQASHVFCGNSCLWIVTTWSALLGLSSGPADATLEGTLTGFAWRA